MKAPVENTCHTFRCRRLRPRTLAGGLVGALVGCASSACNGQTSLTTELVVAGLSDPLFVTHAPGDFERIFIVEQTGAIRIVRDGALLATPFLDVDELSVSGGEQGLLGLAFHPDYADNGFLYINYTDNAGDTVVARYRVSDDPDAADPGSASIVLRIDQPYANHNGGWLGFGPDGYLYIATGDGGWQFDPENRAQDITDELLGKVLRIDVDGDDFPSDAERNYAIPLDNPFVGEAGDDEIWAYGLRNPWRCAFDGATGDFYIADVGQFDVEEINFQPADSGGDTNYGWRCMEGAECTGRSGCTCNDPALTMPVHQYAHEGPPPRCSVTGGEVYRGCALPDLVGTYFFADFCSGEIWSLRVEDGVVTDLQNRAAELAPGGGLTISSITSFGRDAWGELYICDQGGEVYKIVPDGAGPAIVASEPPDGAIDARQPFAPDGSAPSGWRVVTLIFDALPDCLRPESFRVTQEGGAAAPVVAAVDAGTENQVMVTLDRPIEPFARTVIEHRASGTGVALGWLPSDVDGDGLASGADVAFLVSVLAAGTPVLPVYSADIDRSGGRNPADILRAIDLLNGAGAYEASAGRTLP